MPHGWYLGVDMQLFIISPLIFVPMWHLWTKKGAVWSIAYGSIWLFADTLLLIIMTIVRDWPGINDNSAEFFGDNYLMPWCRFQPYGVGIVLGVILHRTKKKPPKLSMVEK